MALGGGFWEVMNKLLPGSYINVISKARASGIFGDRGYVAVPISLDWGFEGLLRIEREDIQKNSLEMLGYAYQAPELLPLREAFRGAKTVYAYNLLSAGKKASGTLGAITVRAKYTGKRGNDITVVSEADPDQAGFYKVTTYLGKIKADTQKAKALEDLKENDFVVFSGEALAPLTASAGVVLTGGENGIASGEAHSNFLAEVEKVYVNAVACPVQDRLTQDLYIAWVKRLRDMEGVKLQVVVFGRPDANHEGVLSVNRENAVESGSVYGLVYWLTGWAGGCPVNRSNGNKLYDGEYEIKTQLKQYQLEQAIKEGSFTFHKVDGKIRTLSDINTFTEFTTYKNVDFSKNQVVRVLDQRAMDMAKIFNGIYLDKEQNNAIGRANLHNEFVKHAQQMTSLGAIEEYVPEDTKVLPGDEKWQVAVTDNLKPVMAMSQMYMTIVVI